MVQRSGKRLLNKLVSVKVGVDTRGPRLRFVIVLRINKIDYKYIVDIQQGISCAISNSHGFTFF